LSGAAPLWPEALPQRSLDLLGIGECSLDQVIELDQFPVIGGKHEVRAWHERPGGQVATAVLAAQRLGLRTALVSAVGDDPAASKVLAPLGEAGVDLARVRRLPGARTRSAMILLERGSGERAVLGSRDPALRATADDFRAEWLDETRVLHLDASDLELSLAAARAARSRGIPVLLDADTPQPGIEALFRSVDFPIVSESLARASYGSGEAALGALVALGARLAVVTLGVEGAIGASPEARYRCAGFRVAALDTTGAGDVFHGAFAWGLLQGFDAQTLLRHCNAAAALSCTGLGAQGSLPSAYRVVTLAAEASVTTR
jgi:sulfofructose kinase